MDELRVYTIEQVAEKLSVTRRTVYSYVKEGKLKAVKIGKYWRVTEDNLKAFLETGKHRVGVEIFVGFLENMQKFVGPEMGIAAVGVVDNGNQKTVLAFQIVNQAAFVEFLGVDALFGREIKAFFRGPDAQESVLVFRFEKSDGIAMVAADAAIGEMNHIKLARLDFRVVAFLVKMLGEFYRIDIQAFRIVKNLTDHAINLVVFQIRFVNEMKLFLGKKNL